MSFYPSAWSQTDDIHKLDLNYTLVTAFRNVSKSSPLDYKQLVVAGCFSLPGIPKSLKSKVLR